MSVKTESGSLKVTFKECGRTFLVKRVEKYSCEGCMADVPDCGVLCGELPNCVDPTTIVFLKELGND